MNKRRVLKITPILITLNILVLFVIISFYTFRLIKYYKLEHANKGEGATLLVDDIKKKRSYLDETKGLVFYEEDNSYIYKGEVEDNYLSYSGLIYRIIGIDKDNNIRAVSEENVTLMYSGFEKGYKDSYVNKWLNASDEKYSGVFENTLVNSKSILAKTYLCSDVVDDMENITCKDNKNENKIALLSLYDYKEAGGKSSFLNNGNTFNLGTLNKDFNDYYVTEDGDIALQQKQNRAILIRPVITIDSGCEKISGDGTKNKPYVIEKHDIKTLGDAYVGSYIKLKDGNYRIINILENSVLIAKSGVLMNEDESKMSIKFGGTDNIYNTSTGVGKYLNNTYLDSFELKDSTVKGEFYVGVINLNSSDYSLLKEKSVKAKVGMLTMGDMFVNANNNVLTTFRGIEAPNIIYAISESGAFFGDTISSKYNVSPAVYVKDDLKITAGSGTIDKPFEIGVESEGK